MKITFDCGCFHENVCGPSQHALPGFGKCDTSTNPTKKARSNPLLELSNMSRDDGLRDLKLIRGAREVAKVSHYLEDPKLL